MGAHAEAGVEVVPRGDVEVVREAGEDAGGETEVTDDEASVDDGDEDTADVAGGSGFGV